MRELFTKINGDDISEPLNPNFTFDNMVFGHFNEAAYFASQEFARNTESTCNPLYIYGGTGLGKTHLLMAIGNMEHSIWPTMRVAYIRADRFIIEYMRAFVVDRCEEFIEWFQNVDLLIVDDVHILAENKRVQNEFRNIIKVMQDAGKQVALAGNSMPDDIQDLGEWLCHYFKSGLVVKITQPGKEDIMNALRMVFAADFISIPEDRIKLIADSINRNFYAVREAIESRSADVYGHTKGQGIRFFTIDEMLNKNLSETESTEIADNPNNPEYRVSETNHRTNQYPISGKGKMLIYKLYDAEKGNLLKLYGNRYDITDVSDSFISVIRTPCDAIVFNPYVLDDEEWRMMNEAFICDAGTLRIATIDTEEGWSPAITPLYSKYDIAVDLATADAVYAIERKLSGDDELYEQEEKSTRISAGVISLLNGNYFPEDSNRPAAYLSHDYQLISRVFELIIGKLNEIPHDMSPSRADIEYERLCRLVGDFEWTPHHDIAGEQSVLGAVLINGKVINDISQILRVDDFYLNSHRAVYKAMLELKEKDEYIDLITITEELDRNGELEKCGGIGFLCSLVNAVQTADNAVSYAKIVKEKSVLRKL